MQVGWSRVGIARMPKPENRIFSTSALSSPSGIFAGITCEVPRKPPDRRWQCQTGRNAQVIRNLVNLSAFTVIISVFADQNVVATARCPCVRWIIFGDQHVQSAALIPGHRDRVALRPARARSTLNVKSTGI